MKVQRLEEQTRKAMTKKQFSIQGSANGLLDQEEEIMRFLQRTLPNSKARLGRKLSNQYIVDDKVFDLNKYNTVSPFAKTTASGLFKHP